MNIAETSATRISSRYTSSSFSNADSTPAHALEQCQAWWCVGSALNRKKPLFVSKCSAPQA